MQYNTCNRSSVKIVDVFRPKVFHSGGRNVFNNMRMLIALHSIFVGCKSTEEHGSTWLWICSIIPSPFGHCILAFRA